MTNFLVVFSALMTAVNLPIGFGITSKRLGFLILLGTLISKIIVNGRLNFKPVALEWFYFWVLFILSSIAGVALNYKISGTEYAIFFTFVIIVILKLNIDNSKEFDINKLSNAWLSAVLVLSYLFLFQIASILNFDIVNILGLRKELLDVGFSINSMFNQAFVLIFCNLFFIVALPGSKTSKCLVGFAVVFLVAFTVFSLSRQNLVAIFLLFSLMFWGETSKKAKSILVLLSFPILSYFVIPKLSVDDFSSINTRIEKTVTQITSADYARFKQYKDSFTVGIENPFTGIGLGRFGQFAKELGYPEGERVPEAAVNQITAEHGAIMLLIFIIVYVLMMKRFSDSGIKTNQQNRRMYRYFFISFSMLLFFNEIHVQTSLWAIFLIGLIIINSEHTKHGLYTTTPSE
ncbi:O-antigen ligase family protein [Psychrobium sp. nBUS_13]|uniref:O-antigen ligase family protein n=1 Tax=Psychrobium sp. nBUS_13 TaxID=3395319 RepID=UPI003EC03D45